MCFVTYCAQRMAWIGWNETSAIGVVSREEVLKLKKSGQLWRI